MKNYNLIEMIIRQVTIILTLVLTSCCFYIPNAYSQTRDTDHKANQNLRSNTRVNPSTLAMEFSLPLGIYPGRSGNSMPIALNYSSKVWTMRHRGSGRQHNGGIGSQSQPYLITTYISVLPQFSERTVSGWSSSLQPIDIIPEIDYFNLLGNQGFAQISGENISGGAGCQLIGEEWSYDEECPNGRHKLTYQCPQEEQLEGSIHTVEYCYNHGGPHQFPGPEPLPPSNVPGAPTNTVIRVRLQMPDGTTREFRKDDKVYDCNYPGQSQFCTNEYREGTYISIDGSGMRLGIGEMQSDNLKKNVLYLPSGAKYIFDLGSEVFIDENGNRSTYNWGTQTWTDTLGREIVSPLPLQPDGAAVGTKTYTLPQLSGQNRSVTQKWEKLKPDGCTTGNEPICAEGALENPADQLYNIGTDTCAEANSGDPVNPSLFLHDPAITDVPEPTNTNPQVWYQNTNKFRTCGGLFNPVVLRDIILPDGSKYQFKYNRYGEITKITYPTGAYERFRYDEVGSLNTGEMFPYTQVSRGVVERWISEDGVNENQHWQYNTQGQSANGQSTLKVTTIAPDDTKTERVVFAGHSGFGFEDPRNGMPIEEKVYTKRADPNNESSRTLVKRTLTEWIVAPPRDGGSQYAMRDARVSRTVSVIFENGLALATLSKTEYDDSNYTADPEYFSHLNAKKSKGYHYRVLDPNAAKTLDLAAIADLFSENDLASIAETDYLYDPNYKAKNITGLPVATRILNPNDPNDILAKTETIYDNTVPASSPNYNYSIYDYGIGSSLDCSTDQQNPKICWQNPNSALRGSPTTVRVWNKDGNSWIESHTQYDQFGNAVKVKDAIGNEAETQFGSQYLYAYPTRVIAPAPDPTGTHGTTEKSEATTVYDFTTGLPLTATSLGDLTTSADDQTTATEYDGMLRPIRVYPVNFVAPEARTEYGTPDSNGQFPASQRFVKTRKQIDEQNWDEAIVWADGLGRTIKTEAKDSQGDVFTETKYDEFGRVKWTSNPYRAGDVKYWSRPRYDDLSRVFESCAPVEDSTQNPLDFNADGACPSGTSSGVTAYSISTVTNFVGTVVTSTDASGRKSRSITNALGQLLRVDEATATGGTADADLGTLANPAQPTFYNYSPQGKMVKVQQGKTGDASIQYRYFLYDSLGRLIRVRQPEQEVNTPALDKTDPMTGNNQWTAAFTYDVLGNVLTATDANGTVITNTYDKANRITTKTYSNEPNSQTTPAVSYFYDGKGLDQPQSPNYAKGKLTKVTSSVSETRYTSFDYLGRLLQMEQRTPFTDETIANATPRVSSYQYDFGGRLVQETYPSGRVVKNEFEADGDLARIYGKANSNAIERTYANGFSYTPDGRIQRLKLGNNRWESAKFNSRLQVTELALGTADGDGSLWKLAYEYGELTSNGTVDTSKNTGNIAKQILSFNGLTNPLVQTFKYDSLYRLTEAGETTNNNQTWKEAFSYDRFGNRTGKEKFTGTTQIVNDNKTHPTIDPLTNRFNSGQNYQYDKNGNLTQDAEGRVFVFNGENKQRLVAAGGQNVGEYFYDGEGKRVKKIAYDNGVVTEETIFVYSAGKLVAEYSTAAPPQNPTTKWTATDQLGSPRVITDSLGNVISRRDFLPFGEEAINNTNERPTSLKYGTADGVRQKFTGYQKDDETGLDFAEARMYENRHGRFTAVDPLLASGKSANPQTFNRYVYVGNNPITRIDPTGTIWIMTPTSKAKDGTQQYRYKWIKGNKVPNGSNAVVFTDIDKKGEKYTEYYSSKAKTWVRIYENRDGYIKVWKPATPGTDGDSANALAKDLGKRAPGLMKIMHFLSIPVAIAAVPVTAGPALLSTAANGGAFGAGAALGSAVVNPDSPNPDEPKKFNTITVYRGFNSGSPSDFNRRSQDTDGLSVFETPSSNHKNNLPFQIVYQGEKVPGTVGTVVSPDLGCDCNDTQITATATYTPDLGEGHWSLNFNVSDDEAKKALSARAKAFKRGEH